MCYVPGTGGLEPESSPNLIRVDYLSTSDTRRVLVYAYCTSALPVVCLKVTKASDTRDASAHHRSFLVSKL